MRSWLHYVDGVREVDSVLDEGYKVAVPNDVQVSLLGMELDGKTAHLTDGILRGWLL